MPYLIPLSPDGDRTVTVDTGSGHSRNEEHRNASSIYRFRTYYSDGPEQRWLLDISDAQGAPLLCGIPIATGSANLLKGQGDVFPGVQLVPVLLSGGLGDAEAPGNTLHLLWLKPGEENPFPALDPMNSIAENIVWHDRSEYYQQASNTASSSEYGAESPAKTGAMP